MDIVEMYKKGMSTVEISNETGIHRSTVRNRIFKAGVLRSRKDGVVNARDKGLLGSGFRGKKRIFTQEHKDNISKSKIGIGKGYSLKPNGYYEITMGENKGRSLHIVIMEKHIGRRLYANECVHHIDHNKTNNDISNLVVMTRSDHNRLHAKENIDNIKRDEKGRFKK